MTAFARATRIRTLPMVVAPVALGAALAFERGFDFAWGWFFLTVVGAGALHLGANVINDVYDETPDSLARIDRGAIATDSGLIESGQKRLMIRLAAGLFGVAAAVGVVLAVARGWEVLPLGAGGFLLGWQYVAPPLKYGYRGHGLGEVGIFVAFGLLAVTGSYYVQAKQIDGPALWASIVPGLLATIVLFNHNLLHHRSDKAAGKMTPVAILGPENGLIISGAAWTATYVVLTVQVAFRLFPVWSLATVVTAIPVAGAWVRAFRDPLAQNCLNFLGATLGASVLTTMTIALSLLFWR
jgi:1,4-dihydroxy-2-naphthoate polyprenyltransferase